jgi:hypothetical protein
MVDRHGDVFELVAEPASWFTNKPVQFIRTTEGNVEGLRVPWEPAVRP